MAIRLGTDFLGGASLRYCSKIDGFAQGSYEGPRALDASTRCMSDASKLPGPEGSGRSFGEPVSYATLDGILARARARLLLNGTLAALGIGLAAFSALTLLGALALGLHSSGAVRWTFLGLMAGGLTAGAIAGELAAGRSASFRRSRRGFPVPIPGCAPCCARRWSFAASDQKPAASRPR